ncbi:MAG: winged helix-turn-helix domain-containing protein [Candidatus Nanopelagicales bacterium]
MTPSPETTVGTELGCIRIHPLLLDRDSRRVFVSGTEVQLSRVQFDVLEMLMENPRRVVDRRTLLLAGWGGYGSSKALEDAISRLRARIAVAGGPRIAECVRGVGYRLGIAVPPVLGG